MSNKTKLPRKHKKRFIKGHGRDVYKYVTDPQNGISKIERYISSRFEELVNYNPDLL